MASCASNPTPLCHARSISLPSRPNPLVLNIDEQAQRLSSSSEATTPSSSSSLSHRLSKLQDLLDSLNVLLQLTHTRQLLSRESHEYKVDELLSSSLYFLDVCSIAKDVLVQRREQAQDLQSVLRRKRGDESELMKESAKYLALGKKSKRQISKSLRDLKSKCSNWSPAESEPNTEATFSMFRKAELASSAVFGSLLSFLLGPKAQSKASSWSLRPKFIVSSKRVSPEQESSSEFEDVDSMLQALIHGKKGKNFSLRQEDLQGGLWKMQSSIQELEEQLESMLRCIIRTRASLLNILTH
ncbi:hypothetical protein SAY87_006240 [Trapa incisa]|uniref:Uncharacterized protein n=2 Tax=Trapa TaxID=22665 RepID=A0AAN7L0A5_TRANT|nr:hypothetical protein SAY87_006240 [Trapa incisa]KAK4772491.1 hypothetical protein SAY86_014266 [Trapa natans]